MDVDLYGSSLPTHLGGKQSIQDSDPRHHLGDNQYMHESDPRHVSDEHSGQSEEPSRVVSARPKKYADKRKHKVRSRYPSSSSGEDQSPVHKHRSSKPSRALSDQDQPQHDPDPLFYREVAMADLPSQYAEEVETFRRILNLPDPRETMPRSSSSVLGLDDQKGQQEHYHQWLRSAIHLKTKIGQSSLIHSGWIQGPSQRTSSVLLQPVFSVKEHSRKGGKCKISWVLQSPVSSPQASPKVEASDRPKQAQHLPTCRKVQNGNSRVHQGLSDFRGMGVVNRPIRGVPSHPHPTKLKEVPKVLPQVSAVPVHLPSFRTSHSLSGLYNNCTGGEADDPRNANQTSPIPGPLADQGPVSGRSPSEHSGSGRPDSVLRVDNKSGEIRTKTCSSVFVRGL